MGIKHLISVVILSVLLTSSFLPINSSATSWAYSFVVWDGYIYVISDEYVTEIVSEIGQVTKYSDMEQYSGNFSNAYNKGTKYYSIEGISTDVAIAIQEDDGKYRKAVREREYTYKGETFELSGWVVGVLVLFIIIMISIYFIYKKKIK
jgi:hypothetical protein